MKFEINSSHSFINWHTTCQLQRRKSSYVSTSESAGRATHTYTAIELPSYPEPTNDALANAIVDVIIMKRSIRISNKKNT